MNPVTADQILKNALRQPAAERARIAEALIASLEETPSPKVEKAWQKEIAKRLREIDSGAVACIPWEEVRERLRRNTHAGN